MTPPSQIQGEISQMKVRMDKYDDILETMRIQAGKTDILIEEMQKRSTILETAIGKLGDSLIPIGNAIVRLEERNAQNDRMRTIMSAVLAFVVPAAITIIGWFVTHH